MKTYPNFRINAVLDCAGLPPAKDIPSTLEFARFNLDLECGKNEDGTEKVPTFRMLANTGVPMRLPNFEDKVIIDIKGFSSPQKIPALKDHKTEVGHTTKIEIDSSRHEITAEGILSIPNEESDQIRISASRGFPWQASVGADVVKASFLEEGDEAFVNGRKWVGPLIIAQKTIGRELTITKLGADGNTSVTVAATRNKDNNKMNEFEKWLAASYAGMEFTDEQKGNLETYFNSEIAAKKSPPPLPAKVLDSDLERIKASNERIAANEERLEAFDTICANYQGVELNPIYMKENLGVTGKTIRALKGHAIRENWTADRFELEARRSERNDMGDHVITKSKPVFEASNMAAISCAMARGAGMVANAETITSGCMNLPADRQTYQKYGYEHMYKEEVLEASDQFSNWSLCMLLDQANIQANGSRSTQRLGSDGWIQETRRSMRTIEAAGNTTTTGLTIFDDVAKKLLWAAYESIASTWENWVHKASVSDFKTSNIYRMHQTGGYHQVGSDGQLKHGSMSNDKFTHEADTFGKIVGMSRKDLINDDLGALNTIMSSLGIEGKRFLEELFYVHLLDNITTLFPAADTNKNYRSGAGSDLTVDGLTGSEQKFVDQTIDGAPIGIMSNLILVGSQDSVLASELYTKTNLDVLQTANSKGRPNGNIHVGKFRPVVSGYLNNTAIKQRIGQRVGSAGAAIPNQDTNQWFHLPQANHAMGAIVIGSFLNGNVRPIIQQGDPAFDVLGLLWRAYHDAGANNGDPKLGVYNAGA